MNSAFLLRFQEGCLDYPPSPVCGTKTETRQKSEAADSDLHAHGYSTFPPTPHATQTGTAVKTESADRDPRSSSLRPIPRCF